MVASMMSTSPFSLSDLRAALPDLAAEAKARSVEFEERRRIAPDFAEKLRRAGVFRMLVPADAAGLGGSLPQWLEVIMTLAEADASTGWVSAHGNICAGLIYASAEPRFRDEFFADVAAYAAWSNLPRVKVKEQDDGVRISGSWSFELGCTMATYVGGMVMLPPLSEGGPPRMVAALAPASEATIEETWDPVGLAGTGSHDVHFDDLFVPWHRTFPWPSGIAVSSYPAAVFVPGTWFVSMGAAATHLGLARRALDEARNELRARRALDEARTSCAARSTATPSDPSSRIRPPCATSRRPRDFGSPVALVCARRWPISGNAACAASRRRPRCA